MAKSFYNWEDTLSRQIGNQGEVCIVVGAKGIGKKFGLLKHSQFDYQRVRAEVHDYCSMADPNTFDEEGIVCALRDMAYDNDLCISSIDDVDPETWEDLIEKFDTGTITTIA